MIQFFSTRGRLSARQYRIFLAVYFFLFIPLVLILVSALLVIGARSPTGLFRLIPVPYLMGGSVLIAFTCLVPFFATTIRRLHDLNLRGRDVLLKIRPKLPKNLLQKMLWDAGDDFTTIHGKNPGRYE